MLFKEGDFSISSWPIGSPQPAQLHGANGQLNRPIVGTDAATKLNHELGNMGRPGKHAHATNYDKALRIGHSDDAHTRFEGVTHVQCNGMLASTEFWRMRIVAKIMPLRNGTYAARCVGNSRDVRN